MSTSRSLSSTFQATSATALLASDDPGRRLHWLNDLKSRGYLVLSAPDVDTAQNLLATFKIDLAIISLSDEREHATLVRSCKRSTQRIPILVPGGKSNYEALDLATFLNVASMERTH